MIPSKLQHERDGKWWPWIAGHVDSDILRMKKNQSEGKSIMVNGVVVYGLKFENGTEWNVKEGWK